MESEDISDLLNRVEYVSEVYSYDRELLVAYQETVQQVADLESQLEQELADMEELKQSYDQQEASLNQVINEKRHRLQILIHSFQMQKHWQASTRPRSANRTR